MRWSCQDKPALNHGTTRGDPRKRAERGERRHASANNTAGGRLLLAHKLSVVRRETSTNSLRAIGRTPRYGTRYCAAFARIGQWQHPHPVPTSHACNHASLTHLRAHSVRRTVTACMGLRRTRDRRDLRSRRCSSTRLVVPSTLRGRPAMPSSGAHAASQAIPRQSGHPTAETRLSRASRTTGGKWAQTKRLTRPRVGRRAAGERAAAISALKVAESILIDGSPVTAPMAR